MSRYYFAPHAGAAFDAGRSAERRFIVDGLACRLMHGLDETDARTLAAEFRVPHRLATQPPVLGGRGSVWRFDLPGQGPVVIKAYRRGGMLRVVRRWHYLRWGASRPDREIDALRAARAAGVCVPEPVAGFVRGTMVYRGWLVTKFVEGQSLVSVSGAAPSSLPAIVSQIADQVLVLIRHRIAHVDLHPGNVVITPAGQPCFVDFDRAISFPGSPEELREHYLVRWTRAVQKHGLPAPLADLFHRGLSSPDTNLTCSRRACAVCQASSDSGSPS
jgi:hypothetical protein